MEMTLEQAIEHAKDVGFKMVCDSKTRDCGKEHLQLANWLEELRLYRKLYPVPKTGFDAI